MFAYQNADPPCAASTSRLRSDVAANAVRRVFLMRRASGIQTSAPRRRAARGAIFDNQHALRRSVFCAERPRRRIRLAAYGVGVLLADVGSLGSGSELSQVRLI